MFVQPTAPPGNFSGGATGITGAPMPSMELPTSTVEVSIRCTDLCDRDIMSKSDPLCVVFQKVGNTAAAAQWYLLYLEFVITWMYNDLL